LKKEMKQTRTSLIFILLLLLPLALVGASDRPEVSAVETITAAELHSIVSFLASDEMEGRDTGTTENLIAAGYLANQLELLGLKPAGDNGSFFQNFDVIRGHLGEPNELALRLADGTPVRTDLFEDYFPSPLSASGSVTGSLAYVGYGITAPEFGVDDYAGVDLGGRIAVITAGALDDELDDRPEGPVDTEYGRESYKILNAQTHGAKGVIFVSKGRWGSLRRQARYWWPEGDARVRLQLADEVDRVHIPAIYLKLDLMQKAVGEDLADLRESGSKGSGSGVRFLDTSVSMDIHIERTRITTRNVLAELPGSDPILRHEAVVVSAHLDHVGMQGRRIFNGADDDASGSAGVLEIAEAFAMSPAAPHRTILLALWNAEEQGLLGSRFFVNHPTFPIGRIRAVFQMDMIGRNQEVTDPDDMRFEGMARQSAAENENTLNLVGYSRSKDLERLIETADRSIGLKLLRQLDDQPLQLIRRSDNWPFLVKGVPAMLFTTGLHPDYHTPADIAGKLNYPKMERVVRLIYLSAWQAANSDQPLRLDDQ
jgi:hypothetical protein